MRSIEEVLKEKRAQMELLGAEIAHLEKAIEIMERDPEPRLNLGLRPHDSTQPMMTQVPINPPIGKGWP